MSTQTKKQSDHWLQSLIEELREQEDVIRSGGGEKRIKSQHDKGKMTARERIHALIDNETNFYELGLWAGHEMYDEVGGCPSGGVVTGIGKVSKL